MKAKIHQQGTSESSVEVRRLNLGQEIRNLGQDIGRGFFEELLTGSAKNIREQIFGNEIVLKEGEEVMLRKEKAVVSEKVKQAEERRANIEYVRSLEQNIQSKERLQETFVEKRVEEILVELRRITKSSREMEIAMKEVEKETRTLPPKSGVYHENFFFWLLSLVKNARIKVEEGANWLRLFTSRKKQKQYWYMFKKHKTSFSFSNERTVATQTG
jgi:hypothetical protein